MPSRWLLQLVSDLGIALSPAQWACWAQSYIRLLLCGALLVCSGTSLITRCAYIVTSVTYDAGHHCFFFCCCCSVAKSRLTIHDPMDCSMPGFLSLTMSWSLPKLMSIESVIPTNHLILCHPLLLLPSVFSSIRLFSSKSTLWIRWPKYWSFSLRINILPMNIQG